MTYYTQATAARIAGLTRQRINQLIKNGQLGYVTIHGRIYVSSSSLHRYLAQRKDNSTC